MESHEPRPEIPAIRKYAAFISYRHADNFETGRRWADWLHQALETYEIPRSLIRSINQRGEPVPPTLYPVFRDEEELPADADLSQSIERALINSSFLIVLCSPRACESRFVAEEIRNFKEMGKADRILALLIDGEPNASEDPAKAEKFGPAAECLPVPLRRGVPRPDGTIDWDKHTEPIAADVRPEGKPVQGYTTAAAYRAAREQAGSSSSEVRREYQAYGRQLELARLKIIAGCLGIPVGTLRNRDAMYRARKARVMAITFAGIAVAGLLLAGVALYQRNVAISARDRADRSLGATQQLGRFVVDDLSEKLEVIGRLDLLHDTAGEVQKMLAAAPFDPDSIEALNFRAEVATRLAEVSLKQGNVKRARELFSEALPFWQRVLELDPSLDRNLRACEAQAGLAKSYYELGEQAEAEAAAEAVGAEALVLYPKVSHDAAHMLRAGQVLTFAIEMRVAACVQAGINAGDDPAFQRFVEWRKTFDADLDSFFGQEKNRDLLMRSASGLFLFDMRREWRDSAPGRLSKLLGDSLETSVLVQARLVRNAVSLTISLGYRDAEINRVAAELTLILAENIIEWEVRNGKSLPAELKSKIEAELSYLKSGADLVLALCTDARGILTLAETNAAASVPLMQTKLRCILVEGLRNHAKGAATSLSIDHGVKMANALEAVTGPIPATRALAAEIHLLRAALLGRSTDRRKDATESGITALEYLLYNPDGTPRSNPDPVALKSFRKHVLSPGILSSGGAFNVSEKARVSAVKALPRLYEMLLKGPPGTRIEREADLVAQQIAQGLLMFGALEEARGVADVGLSRLELWNPSEPKLQYALHLHRAFLLGTKAELETKLGDPAAALDARLKACEEWEVVLASQEENRKELLVATELNLEKLAILIGLLPEQEQSAKLHAFEKHTSKLRVICKDPSIGTGNRLHIAFSQYKNAERKDAQSPEVLALRQALEDSYVARPRTSARNAAFVAHTVLGRLPDDESKRRLSHCRLALRELLRATPRDPEEAGNLLLMSPPLLSLILSYDPASFGPTFERVATRGWEWRKKWPESEDLLAACNEFALLSLQASAENEWRAVDQIFSATAPEGGIGNPLLEEGLRILLESFDSDPQKMPAGATTLWAMLRRFEIHRASLEGKLSAEEKSEALLAVYRSIIGHGDFAALPLLRVRQSLARQLIADGGLPNGQLEELLKQEIEFLETQDAIEGSESIFLSIAMARRFARQKATGQIFRATRQAALQARAAIRHRPLTSEQAAELAYALLELTSAYNKGNDLAVANQALSAFACQALAGLLQDPASTSFQTASRISVTYVRNWRKKTDATAIPDSEQSRALLTFVEWKTMEELARLHQEGKIKVDAPAMNELVNRWKDIDRAALEPELAKLEPDLRQPRVLISNARALLEKSKDQDLIFLAAEALSQIAILEAPNDPEVQWKRAIILDLTARPLAALDQIENALESKPSHPNYLWSRYLIEENAGYTPAAEYTYRQLLAALDASVDTEFPPPEKVDLWLRMAERQFRLGDREAAALLVRKILQAVPNATFIGEELRRLVESSP